MEDRNRDKGTETAEGKRSEGLSKKLPERVSGEGETPLGATDEHSDAPGPHGTGEIYPRGNRSEEREEAQQAERSERGPTREKRGDGPERPGEPPEPESDRHGPRG